MSDSGDVMNGEGREQLERRAEAVRARLERRLEALDERRDHVIMLAKKATRPPVSIVLLGAATFVGAAIVVRQFTKKHPSRGKRLGAAVLGVPAQKPEGFFVRALKQAALSLVATLVHRVGARGLDRLLPEAEPAPAAVLPEESRPPVF